MDTLIRSTLGLATVAWLVGPGAVSGQERPGDVRHRNDCRLAEQILYDGQPDVRRTWALGIIGTCDQAATLLAQLWSAPPSDDTELQALYRASARVGDGRVFEAAFGVAADAGMPAPTRVAALGVVVSSVHPEVILSLVDRTPLEGVPPLEWNDVWGTVDHPVQLEGAVPLPENSLGRVGALAQELAETATDALVRDAAWWLTHMWPFLP